jgi:transposase-like protein
MAKQTTKLARRNYSNEEKAAALETVNLCGGNVSEAARTLGIERETLRQWSVGHCVSERVFADFAEKKQGRMTAKLRALQDRLADELMREERISEARYGELNAAFGTVTDKLRLMDGDPTHITEYRQRITLAEAEASLADLLPLYDTRQEAIEALASVFPEMAAPLLAAMRESRVVEGELVD